MEKFLPLFLMFFGIISVSLAQNEVQLKIHHKLAAEDFAFNQAAKTNIDHDFKATRLQYYLSGFTIIHDGGMETAIEDTWILVNANFETLESLGTHEINIIEGIKFHVGVGADVNHNDPASWPNGHPLAPVWPSMHWGWAAGYRFLAYEGKGGAAYNQTFQLHGLGDDNYFETTVQVDAEPVDGIVTMNLYGDYTRVLEDLNINAGVIEHSETGPAKKALENMRDYTFTGELNTSTVDFSEINDFKVFPNPSFDGNTTFQIEASENLNYEVSVTDVLGRTVQFFNEVQSNTSVNLNLENAGFYNLNLIKEGQIVLTKKLLVQ